MDPTDILIWLVIGAIAGWLASHLIKGGGYGLIGDIIVGIVGLLLVVALLCFWVILLGRSPATIRLHHASGCSDQLQLRPKKRVNRYDPYVHAGYAFATKEGLRGPLQRATF